MQIKQLCKTKEDYIAFVDKIFSWKKNTDRSAFKPEDREKLEPFFAYEKAYWAAKKPRGLNEEEHKSYEYFRKCMKDYAGKEFDIRDGVRLISSGDLCNAFYYKNTTDEFEDDNDYDDEYVFDEEEFPFTFPLIVTGMLESSFDRIGDTVVCSVSFVSLNDFDNPAGNLVKDEDH